tara:strand:- start:783 stop:2411 length:1629 start_codon:yes stop_codon:yes gene_type:complete
VLLRNQASLERELIGVRSELRAKDLALETSLEETRKLRLRVERKGSNGAASPSSARSDGSSYDSGDSRASQSSSDRDENDKERLEFVMRENAQLKLFLKDYGMTWVGDGSDGDGSGSGSGGEKNNTKPAAPARRKVHSNRLKQRAEAARKGKGGELIPTVLTQSADTTDTTEENAPMDVLIPKQTKTESGETPKLESSGDKKKEPKPFAVDVEKLLVSIAELNAVAGDGKSKVVTGTNGSAKLVTPTPKTVTLFADGFFVDDDEKVWRAFRDSETNVAYVKDLLDGFFPYEYKESFPNGVPFKLVDKTSELGAPLGNFKAFSGGGARLDGGAMGAAKPTGDEKKNNTQQEKREKTATQKDQVFLEKLPKVVVRAGVVVPVRESVGREMRRDANQTSSQTVLETTVKRGCFRRLPREEESVTGETVEEMTTHQHGGNGDTTPETRKETLSTLRVKGMDGTKMYIVKLAGRDTIGKLRRYLEHALLVGQETSGALASTVSNPSGDEQFEIRNAYPPKTFMDDTQTLRDAGLVPNATLLLRPVAD